MSTNKFLNYYKLLGISREATIVQVRSAYKKLALEYHPDKNKNSKEAERKFKEVLEAYEVLSDPTTKVDYDSEYDYETGNSTSKPKKSSRKPKGGLEAPIYTDYRDEAYRAIWDALIFSGLGDFVEHFGQEYFDILGHRDCGYNKKPCVWAHIYICVDTQNEVVNFRNKMLELFATYAAELAKLRLEAITRLEKQIKNSKLSEHQRKLIKYESNWRKLIQECRTKELVLDIEKLWKETIEQFVKWNEQFEVPSSPFDDPKEIGWKRILEEKRREIKDKERDQRKKTKEGGIPGFLPHEPKKEKNQKDHELYSIIYQKTCERLNNIEPIVSSSELDSSLWSPFSSWMDKLWKLELDQLGDFEKQILKDISRVREVKQKENLNRIFEEAKNETGSELEEKIEQADKSHGSQTYEDNKDRVKSLKMKSAQEDSSAYRQRVIEKIEEIMEESGVRGEELGDKVRVTREKLVNGEIEEPSLIVEAEMTIVSNTSQVGADKKLNILLNQAQQVLETGSKEQSKEFKDQILKFSTIPNIYFHSSWNKRKSEAESLLKKLEIVITSNSERPTNSDVQLPWEVILPIAAVLLFVVFLGVGFIRQRNKRRY